MRDILFQIVLFLVGALIGIIGQIVEPSSQKWIARMLAVLLIAVSLIWAGYELGTRQATPTPEMAKGSTSVIDTLTPTAQRVEDEPSPTGTSTPTRTPKPTDTPIATKTSTPTKTPTPPPTPTHTPEPPPPPSPTPAPSVLSVGQAWQQGGIVLHLQNSFFVLNGAIECECVNFVFDLFNRNPNEILVTIEPWQFSAQDNFGNNLELVTVATHTFCSYLRPLDTLKTSIAPDDSFYKGGYPRWNVSFCGALTSSDYVILTVNGLAGINNAKWKLPLR